MKLSSWPLPYKDMRRQKPKIIRGYRVSGSNTFLVFDPSNKQIIADIANLGVEDFQAVINDAGETYKSFRLTTEHEQSKLLHKYAGLIKANIKDLAVILTMENGKTVAEAEGEVEYGASFIPWFAEEAIRSYGDIIPSQHSGSTNLIIRQSVGPPRETPLYALALAKLVVEAGFPAGAIQVVPTRDRNAVTELYTNLIVQKISFTGSTGVGKLITTQAAGTMKKVSIKLAVDGLLACKFRCSGQTYVCANRLYVQRGIHDRFIEALLNKTRTFKVGPGLDRPVTHGPLINKVAVEKVQSNINDAVEKGTKLVYGGRIPEGLQGHFIEPALLTGVTSCRVSP
ncbi:hypothetical protein S7711_03815 [Stachybotrys chartarum IBT 7711]|uniref:Aldehyde dehydrogenase domain-containing protein n=1 Tax=Stachybotrys chartarum (strain CBS 109288 / IBT 7711) TaxID=1280523 RepID=A0A084AUA1_STACB|nr:hypothetical protein S7711_03815 [Stachybotrys chartarum IBT 7711]